MKSTSHFFHASMKLGAALLLFSSAVACGDGHRRGQPGAGGSGAGGGGGGGGSGARWP